MNAALGDAAWMTGMERNSDIVIMASYAPLLVNVNPGGMQWSSNLIGYDALTSYGSPSYYVQSMFNTHLGDSVLSVTSANIPTQTWKPPTPRTLPGEPAPTPPAPKQVPTLFYVATMDSKKGTLYLKVVNTAAVAQAVQINLTRAANISPKGTAVTLCSEEPDDTNTITDPTKIALGSWLTYGGATQSSLAETCVDRAYDLGVNFFDTANAYAGGGGARRRKGARKVRTLVIRTCDEGLLPDEQRTEQFRPLAKAHL